MKYLSTFILLVPVLVTPTALFAVTDGGGSSVTDGGGNPGTPVTLDNPLESDSLLGFLNDILDVILVFAVPIIVFFIIFAGFKYVTAQGKPEEISKANAALLYAIIGGVLILGANVLLEVIAGTVSAF